MMENPRKNEAMRAKEMAIEMMEKKEFKKAQKLALKAQKLCEEVEKIDQILMICDVLLHSFDEEEEEDEKNWYKILQVDPTTADEASIKRQYSKMALKLHPDRNSFPGAAQAFNLVLEAKTLLADHERRIMYDNRCNAKASWKKSMSPTKKGRKRLPKSHQQNHLSCGFLSKTVEYSDGSFSGFEQGRKNEFLSKTVEYSNGSFSGFEQGRKNEFLSKTVEYSDASFNGFEQGRKKKKCKESNHEKINVEHLNGEFNDFEQEIMCRQSPDHERRRRRRCLIQPDSKVLEYLDGELYDFEKERSNKCFSRGQIWAVYDTLDAMPRLYALINDVVSHDDFEVVITWLEPLQRSVFENRWLCRGLPASFGKFIIGQNETIRDHGIFSHVVTTWKSSSKSSNVYDISPSKGEIWALFKKWGTKSFMNDVERHEYEFDFVEILSDYYEGFGVNVAFLSKVEGLASSFCRKSGKGMDWEVIPSKNRLRFSHKIPSFRVQKGVNGVDYFFELDPASLPINHS